MSELPICTTLAECLEHDGERVQALGVYTLYDPFPGRKQGPERTLLVYLQTGEAEHGPFLEPFWHPDAIRTAEERQQYADEQVKVVGVFYAQQPRQPGEPAEAVSFGGPCIHPVESIDAA